MTHTPSIVAHVAGLSLALLGVLGCQGAPASGASAAEPTARQSPAQIILDGDTREWPAGLDACLAADGRSLYLRFDPGQDGITIQAAPFTTRILIDADQNADTGRVLGGTGAELVIELSPANQNGIGNGTRVDIYDPQGVRTGSGHASAGFMFLPTHAAPSYEARFDRNAHPSLHDTGTVRARIDQIDSAGEIIWSASATLEQLPPLEQEATPDGALPVRHADAARVLSLNVLRNKPLDDPAPFARLLHATKPDIILFQEWFDTDEAVIQAWFDAHMGAGWHVLAPSAREGVAIASRTGITEAIPDLIEVPGGRSATRFVGAVVPSPVGPMLVASVHLKCCGGADTQEDQRRVSESIAINATLSQVLESREALPLVIAGDFNLVGTRAPLDTMRAGLSASGGHLQPAPIARLGDGSAVTWVDESSRFAPGRLDWVLTDDALTSTRQAFALDTRWLSDVELARHGLERGDSAASDHLPLVIDLILLP